MHPASHALLSWLVADAKPLPRRDRILIFAGGLLPDLDGLAILGEARRCAAGLARRALQPHR